MSSEIKLPDFFPRTSKKCVEKSTPFFKCYSDESLKPENLLVAESGKSSLKKCESLLKQYEKCMALDKTRKTPDDYRVQESYRIANL